MSRAGRIARRGFLIGSAAIAGGVAFGSWKLSRPLDNPLSPAAGEAAITPHVLIRADGVTLIVPRADMGQGTQSLQAHLIAEELDIDPAQCRLEPGPPAPAYYNSAVMREGAPFRPTDTGWLAETARRATEAPARLLGLQITGGSSTAPDAWERLRRAGAVARETLKEAAAQAHGLARADLRTEAGAVILPDGTRLAYGDLAAAAAGVAPVQAVVLRAPSQWKYVGRPVPRTDVPAKTFGTQAYGVDLHLPGMLHATVRQAPPGATITAIDSAAAAAMPGVRQVVPVTRGAAVVAETTWHALRAAQALRLDWAAPEGPGDQAAIWDSLAAAFDTRPDSAPREDGDAEAALAGEGAIAAEYRVPFLAHAPLEPLSAVVLATAEGCEIWTGTQVPRFVVARVADWTGLPESAITLHAQMIGGSFGHRLELDYLRPAVEVAGALPGTPVKTMLSREEDFAQDFPRPAAIARGRGRVAPGRIEALALDIATTSPAASWFGRVFMAPPGPDRTMIAGAWDQPLAIPHQRVRGFRAAETVPVSSWRSVGASGCGFLYGGFLDELFAAAGIDPMQGLIDLCSDDLSRRVLEELRDLSGWTGREIGPGHGRGVAFCLSFGVPCAEVVEVRDTPEGLRITRAFAVAEVGRVIDPMNFQAQLSGGMLFGLGHAMNCELTYRGHVPEQANYDRFEAMRLHQCPEVTVKGLENGETLRGIGEPGVPPAAPALANAIFAATGQRIRELPLSRQVRFA